MVEDDQAICLEFYFMRSISTINILPLKKNSSEEITEGMKKNSSEESIKIPSIFDINFFEVSLRFAAFVSNFFEGCSCKN